VFSQAKFSVVCVGVMLEEGPMVLELLCLLPKKEVESSPSVPQDKHAKKLRDKASAH